MGIVNEQYGKKSEKELTNLDYKVTPWEVKHFIKGAIRNWKRFYFLH